MSLRDRLQKTFLELIAINEIYPNEKEILRYTEDRLTALGVRWEEDAFRNIIAKVLGTGAPVFLSTHLDIPEPAPNVQYTIDGDVIRSKGNGVLGADPKTGLAVLLEFLADLAPRDPATHAPIEVAFTRGEETGLLGARALDYSKISAEIGLVLDEDGPVTQVVTQAPAFIRVDAEFLGKVVHPREPENGVNALQAACTALSSLPWGYSAPGVTWNVGVFQSGTARNSVPGTATLKAELRSYDTAKVIAEGERVRKTFTDTAAAIGARVVCTTELEFEGYHLDRSHPLFDRLEQTYRDLGMTPNYFSTFGGSDANIFNAHGITAIPIGSGYLNAHEYTEGADLAMMVDIVRFLNAFCAVGSGSSSA